MVGGARRVVRVGVDSRHPPELPTIAKASDTSDCMSCPGKGAVVKQRTPNAKFPNETSTGLAIHVHVYDRRWFGLLAHNIAAGIFTTIIPATVYPFLNNYLNMEGTQTASARTLLVLPCVFKPFFAIFADCVPLICGLHRRPYVVLGWLVCAFALGSIFFIPIPDPFFRDRTLVGKSLDILNATELATINSSAPSHGAIYVMLMAIGSIGFALADVAAEELTKELALQYFQEIPNDDGVFYNRVNEFRFVSVLVAFLFMALGMSGLDYGGDFDFTIDYNTLMLICGIVAALPTPLVWLCISEKKRERQSFTACGLHAWALFQNHATNAVIAHRFAAGMLAGISATAVNPIAFYWAEVQPMNDNVVSIMAAVAVIFALSYVKKRGWTINYLKVIVVANAIVLVLDAGATFFTIWGVVRSQYMWIGLPVVEALPSSVGYLISTVIIEEVAEPETIPLLKLVVSAVGFLALSFGLTLTKHINSLFNLSNQNLLRDTTRVRTDASITFAIAYVCQFASIAWICAVPRTADAVREWKKTRSRSSTIRAVALLVVLGSCFLDCRSARLVVECIHCMYEDCRRSRVLDLSAKAS